MAIGERRRGSVRDISTLAKRVHERWLAYRRRHTGMSIPVNDTLSRLFEHVPEYTPHRERSPERQDRSAKSPGVFKLQQVADALETTVGDLLGEPGYESPRELLSIAQRRTLREATLILRELFDLDDESLDQPDPLPQGYQFTVAPGEFIERDHDYPRTLHAWVVPEFTASAGPSGSEPELTLDSAQILHSVREVWDSRLQVIRVIGDSMAPELRHGWKVLVDTDLTRPSDDALVAVYLRDEGGVLGRWHVEDGTPLLRKSNPSYKPISLAGRDDWTLWGTVTRIVEAPVELKRP
jgi:phage repressor protein C with HTH and peptisase S24 domain